MEKQIVEKCSWCGVRTALNEKASAKVSYSFDEESGWEEVQTWFLYQCVSCNRPTLKELWEYPGAEDETLNTLMPAGTSDEASLPDPVVNAWKAAQAVRHVEPNAFAVLVGRTLEVICREEGAKGKNLVESLRILADSGRIPGTLGEMAQKLRQIRNLGAHAASDEVRQADVPIIQEFADAILEYLYRAPAKIAAVEARLRSGSP